MDSLTKNTASDLVELLSTDGRFDDIDILEFMYVLSDDRENIHYKDKLSYLEEYRRLSDNQKDKRQKGMLETRYMQGTIATGKMKVNKYLDFFPIPPISEWLTPN